MQDSLTLGFFIQPVHPPCRPYAFGTLLYTGHDWTDPALARRSMELMANEVWPRIDRAVRGTTPRTGGTACPD
jgi:hypothetical protein